jgi:hypothetical protein
LANNSPHPSHGLIAGRDEAAGDDLRLDFGGVPEDVEDADIAATADDDPELAST